MPQLQNCEKRDWPGSYWHDSTRRESIDYEYALLRARFSKHNRLERGYEVARHFAKNIAARRRNEDETLESLFREHSERWKKDTRHLSSTTKMTSHPSYLRIIGLSTQSHGHGLERLLLQELQSEPDHWFAALTAITGEDPVQPQHDFDEAVNAWLEWGRKKGII
jgi:hypothetical protein